MARRGARDRARGARRPAALWAAAGALALAGLAPRPRGAPLGGAAAAAAAPAAARAAALSALGLAPGSRPGAAELKAAFRRGVLRWHPDRDGGDAERLNGVREAFELLARGRGAPAREAGGGGGGGGARSSPGGAGGGGLGGGGAPAGESWREQLEDLDDIWREIGYNPYDREPPPPASDRGGAARRKASAPAAGAPAAPRARQGDQSPYSLLAGAFIALAVLVGGDLAREAPVVAARPPGGGEAAQQPPAVVADRGGGLAPPGAAAPDTMLAGAGGPAARSTAAPGGGEAARQPRAVVADGSGGLAPPGGQPASAGGPAAGSTTGAPAGGRADVLPAAPPTAAPYIEVIRGLEYCFAAEAARAAGAPLVLGGADPTLAELRSWASGSAYVRQYLATTPKDADQEVLERLWLTEGRGLRSGVLADAVLAVLDQTLPSGQPRFGSVAVFVAAAELGDAESKLTANGELRAVLPPPQQRWLVVSGRPALLLQRPATGQGVLMFGVLPGSPQALMGTGSLANSLPQLAELLAQSRPAAFVVDASRTTMEELLDELRGRGGAAASLEGALRPLDLRVQRPAAAAAATAG